MTPADIDLIIAGVLVLAGFVLAYLCGRMVGADKALEKLQQSEAKAEQRRRVLLRQYHDIHGDLGVDEYPLACNLSKEGPRGKRGPKEQR